MYRGISHRGQLLRSFSLIGGVSLLIIFLVAFHHAYTSYQVNEGKFHYNQSLVDLSSARAIENCTGRCHATTTLILADYHSK
ncbi:hypothetical protein GE061_007230 [Apolygus lucorum]|uniref:Uncharacterized protein n=1 Tax=Apolygus lucorum TaxID=248454 RepID=A0A6A4J3H3_APOLU|nr:hypothetical protein GE061_007230 [Apolygus lucorum]